MATDVGGTYRSAYLTYDDTGELADPSTVVLTITAPDQTTTTPTPTNDSTGSYYVDIVLTQEGLYKFVWTTTSPSLSKTDFENAIGYISCIGLAEMREYLHKSETNEDDIIRELMNYATAMAESKVGTLVIRTFTNDPIYGYTKQILKLPHRPVPSNDSVESITSQWTGGPTWAASDILLHPNLGTVESANYMPFYYGPWVATYTAGRTIIPPRVILAVKMIVEDLFACHRETLTDPLSPNYDEESMLAARIPASYEMPPQARRLLKREGFPGFG
jgi:hypothetical protein